ncbi:protein NUCLEAR FUSION DEFECTIVE 4-like [Diospyros lotus]|uniref:protein NUCLEAR FUSION DEFECTIVE 4-like n=1 Tax=Diospyros lotus TaxID=55363 RepID=UPI00225B2CCF|nr:protein NUCLEAR FUSION DEFECTIVE 4-like [Diospyros lotus]
MKEKFDKYWSDYRVVLAFGAILDPTKKFNFLRYTYSKLNLYNYEEKLERVKMALYRLYGEYVNNSLLSSSSMLSSNDFEAFDCQVSNDTKKSQLDLYLEEPRIPISGAFDVLAYWRERANRGKIIAKMACDVLSISITTVASKSAFSIGSRILNKYRSRLHDETVQALLCTRNWLHGFGDDEEEEESSIDDIRLSKQDLNLDVHTTCNSITLARPQMSFQWLSLVAAVWLQSINGTNSNFPAYSSQLKRLLSMSQLQLNNLALASDAGKLLGWLAGVAAVYLPLWLVLLIGSLLGFIGYGVQYLVLINKIPSLSYILVFSLTVLAGNSICWINTVCYIVIIRNFPFDRQVAVALSTSYLGLSAKIYTDLVDAVSPSSAIERAKAYLLLNSTLPLLVCIAASVIVRVVNGGKSRKIQGGFALMFAITIATGTFAVITSFNSMSSSGLLRLIIVIGMGVFLLAPLAIPFAEKAMETLQKKCLIRRDIKVHDLTNIDDHIEEGPKIENGTVAEIKEGSEVEETGVKTMLMKVDFWLYFFVYLCGATLGLVYMNNLGQIAESRGYSRTSSLVSLSSSFGFFGRLVPSLLVYISTRSKCMASSPFSIAAMMAPMAASFFLLLNPTNLSLCISTAIIGLCTGAITTISVSTTTHLFGTKNFSVNHNILIANIPIGSFIFGDLAALIYRRESSAAGSSINGRCMGAECYGTTFIIWGSLCLLGTFLALVLHARTKKFFSNAL